MPKLLLLFVVVPAVELVLLIEIGGRIGTLATLALIVVTGIVGASLARRQGVGVIRVIQEEMNSGRLPTESLVDAAFILVAGALLVTPGILTDAVGFLCLVPAFRRHARHVLRRRFEQAAREGRIRVQQVRTEAAWGPREEKVVTDLRDLQDAGRPPIVGRPSGGEPISGEPMTDDPDAGRSEHRDEGSDPGRDGLG